MFGKIALKFSTGFLIETNETCYKTKVNFIPIRAVQRGSNYDLDFQVGDQVSYTQGVLRKEQYDNCVRCNKSFPIAYAQTICDCYDDLNVIRGQAVLISKVLKTYKHSRGWKITAHMEDPITHTNPSTLHFVIFENSPYYRAVGNSDVGDLCFLKGIEKTTNGVQNKDGSIFVNVFHIEQL